MALDPKARPPLTARSGVARSGAFRSGFAPSFVVGQAPGASGPFYGWRQRVLPATTWTRTKPKP